MNFIGKSCVLLYGAGAIFCLIAAMAVHTQRLNLVAPKGEAPKKTVTLVDQSIERTKDLVKANNRAYTRWVQEYEQVVTSEVDQFKRREFYRGQLELLRTGSLEGMNLVDAGAIQELPDRDEITKLLKLDKPTGRTLIKVSMQMMMENAKPRSVYLTDIGKSNSNIKIVQDNIAKLVVDIGKTTAAIDLIRPRIGQQDDITKAAVAEREYLEDFVTNRRADAQLYVKRRDALKASIARLEKYYKDREKAGGQGN